MPIYNDLFGQINNAVLDLQGAQIQSYERPLKKLAVLLRHPDLDAANSQLTRGLDVNVFLDESIKSQGSMVGSAKLAWPDSSESSLGLSLLLVEKFAQNPDDMIHFAHIYFYSGTSVLASMRSVTSQLIIPFVRDYKEYIMNHGKVRPQLMAPTSNKIFIVHGRDGEARETTARFLGNIGLQPIILHEQASQGRTVIEKVEANGDVGFAVVLLTPDDVGCERGGVTEPRVRQNVLLELGYFIGRLGREKVCSIKRGDVEIPSDFAGVVWIEMDDGNGWKQSLGRELESAGYQIDWNKVMR